MHLRMLYIQLLSSLFKIPVYDRNIRIEEYRRENYLLPPEKSEKYILVEITAFAGRTLDAKRLLYKNITEA